MTNLSDTELNEVIARAKGCVSGQELMGLSCERTVWITPMGVTSLSAPDFTHDSGLAMALLEEIVEKWGMITVGKEKRGRYFAEHISDQIRIDCLIEEKDTLYRAICEAYAEWQGL